MAKKHAKGMGEKKHRPMKNPAKLPPGKGGKPC